MTWTDILTQTENMANEHDRLSSEMSLQVADQLRGLQSRYEEFRKKVFIILISLHNERANEGRNSMWSLTRR